MKSSKIPSESFPRNHPSDTHPNTEGPKTTKTLQYQIKAITPVGLLVPLCRWTQELGNISEFQEKGLVTDDRIMPLKRQKEELIGQIGELDAEFSGIVNAVNEASIKILQIDQAFRESVLSELREVEQEVNDTAQQLQSTSAQLKRIDIKSLVNGIIHVLTVFIPRRRNHRWQPC